MTRWLAGKSSVVVVILAASSKIRGSYFVSLSEDLSDFSNLTVSRSFTGYYLE